MGVIDAKSAYKTVTWRIIASVTTFMLVLIATGELAISVSVSVFDVTLKTIFYYIHERAWAYSG